MKIHPVQKMSSAGQTNRFVCYVLVGDNNGHIGLGSKCSKEVATAIRGGIIAAKLSLIPVRRGYWGNKIGLPHTVPMKVAGKCGSVRVRLVPAPRGSSVVGSPVMKKMLAFCGIQDWDCFTCSCGHTRTKGNFIKATFDALKCTFGYLTPDLWKATHFVKSPFQDRVVRLLGAVQTGGLSSQGADTATARARGLWAESPQERPPAPKAIPRPPAGPTCIPGAPAPALRALSRGPRPDACALSIVACHFLPRSPSRRARMNTAKKRCMNRVP
ncbi:unnamed protein product [Prorocentrum cordatum]|uniref:Small ribosomal subunit protein uS5 n=1 Tax=Prorocentrum cordatum TaxID=2364126 RepID=A0ABN9R6L9_9DINO|nr:unnamed protein product [Polarella glacialis]